MQNNDKLQKINLKDVLVTDEFYLNALMEISAQLEHYSIKDFEKKDSGEKMERSLCRYLRAISQAAMNPCLSLKSRERFLKASEQSANSLYESLRKRDVGNPIKGFKAGELLSGLLEIFQDIQSDGALKAAVLLGDSIISQKRNTENPLSDKFLFEKQQDQAAALCGLYNLFSLTGQRKYFQAAQLLKDAFKQMFEESTSLKGMDSVTVILAAHAILNAYSYEREECKIEAEKDLHFAVRIFETVTEGHTYITGCMADVFQEEGKLDQNRDACSGRIDPVAAMVRFARRLYCICGDKRCSDYIDTAITNYLFSSIDPVSKRAAMYQPPSKGSQKSFTEDADAFLAISDSFTGLGQNIYFQSGNNIFVEQYLSSRLNLKDKLIEQISHLPDEAVIRFQILRASEPFLICFRIPDWSFSEMEAIKNGKRVNLLEGNGHVSLAVREGDKIELKLPAATSLKGLPDGKNAFAFRYGGTVLSADPLQEESFSVADLFDLFDNPQKHLNREGESFYLQGTKGRLSLALHAKRKTEKYDLYPRLIQN